jgi:hypothetical protein
VEALEDVEVVEIMIQGSRMLDEYSGSYMGV